MEFGRVLCCGKVMELVFHPNNDELERITVWVCVPQASIWCPNEVGLNRMGEQIGKVIKLDYLSQYACRGKYAKFCVELDVTKPLLPMICIEGREYKVEYDGLDVVCFSCFWIGNKNGNNNRFAALNMMHGEDLSSQWTDSLGNSGRSQNGNGAKNSNPTGKSVVISERDHVRSIKEGGSSRATTKVLGQLTKWQRKESVNGITKKDTE
ncbi:hypothetical protein SLA2020_013970 [Shorea laevis]